MSVTELELDILNDFLETDLGPNGLIGVLNKYVKKHEGGTLMDTISNMDFTPFPIKDYNENKNSKWFNPMVQIITLQMLRTICKKNGEQPPQDIDLKFAEFWNEFVRTYQRD